MREREREREGEGEGREREGEGEGEGKRRSSFKSTSLDASVGRGDRTNYMLKNLLK